MITLASFTPRHAAADERRLYFAASDAESHAADYFQKAFEDIAAATTPPKAADG